MAEPSAQSTDFDPGSIRIAVLAGGIGSEREVSLQSGANIARAVRDAGFHVRTSDISPDDLAILDAPDIDLFFLALHGRFGEDGQLQQILEDRGLRFTGSGAAASRAAFDKALSKQAFRAAAVPVAPDIGIDSPPDEPTLADRLAALGDRFVVKPLREGSSVGVEIVDGPADAARTAADCFRRFGPCMVEQFIAGREITVGILNGRPLPIIEIRSKAKFYDYQAKYLVDSTEYLFDTIPDPALVSRIQTLAVRCFEALKCRHLSRVDFILTDAGEPFALEINTLPGFTSHSLLPMAAARAGIPAPDLVTQIIRAALAPRPPR